MNRFIILLNAVLITASIVSGFTLDDVPEGWASMNGGTTGGKGGPQVTVSSMSELKNEASSSGKKIILVKKGQYSGTLSPKSDKTIVGIEPGVVITGNVNISGQNNIIIRNIAVRGNRCNSYDECRAGSDAVYVGNGSKNIWLDHLDIADGQDGNCDFTKAADFITVTWCKFWYTYKKEHAFSNLIAGSDDETQSEGKLNTTFQYCWWADNVNQRQPRGRFGKIHVVNNLYTSQNTSYACGPGFKMQMLIENNVFKCNGNGISDAGGGAWKTVGNTGSAKNIQTSKGSVFTPPYKLSKIVSASEVETMVKNGAGATMTLGTNKYSLTTSVAQGQGTITPGNGSYSENQSVIVTATPANGWLFDHWSGALSGSTNPATVTMNANKTISAYFVQDTRNRYTITKQAAPGGSITQSPEGSSLLEGTSVTLTAVPNGGWTFGGWSGDNTGTNATYTIASLSNNVSVSASFMPLDKYIYQAENGVLKDAVLETKNAGFSGDAYVNISAVAGSYIEIPVYVDEAGQKSVAITFANGSGAARQFSISVNGTQQIASLDFEATTDWTTWKAKQIKLTLPQGASTVTLATINGQDGPNIDKIELFLDAVSTGAANRHGRTTLSSYNPVQKVLYIHADGTNNLNVHIFSLNGKTVLSRKFNQGYKSGQVKMPLTELKNGIYLVKIEVDGATHTMHMNVLE